MEGAKSARINFATAKATVEFDSEIASGEAFVAAIRSQGFDVAATVESGDRQDAEHIAHLRRQFLLSLMLGAPLFYLAMGEMLHLPLPTMPLWLSILAQLTLTTAIMAINSGLYVSGLKKLLRRNPNMDSLVEIGTVAAYLYSVTMAVFLWFFPDAANASHVYFESAGVILVFISLGKFLEAKTRGKAGEAIKNLLALQPQTATVVREGEQMETPIAAVRCGDVLFVRVGEKIPVDGVILEGSTTIDESAISGESLPVAKAVGENVIGGTINKTSPFLLEARRVGAETLLAGIIKTVEAALASKAPAQVLADRISFYFVPIVTVVASATFFLWLLMGYGFPLALTTMVSVLIIACPCSLGLATPTAVMMGASIASRHGILIKNVAVLETARQVDVVIFDKTGTITTGTPVVASVLPLTGDPVDLLREASALTGGSKHPFAMAITAHARRLGVEEEARPGLHEWEGMGIAAVEEGGQMALLGNARLLDARSCHIAPDAQEVASQLLVAGESPLYVVRNGMLRGLIGMRDEIREDAKTAVAAIRERGKRVAMISGDKREIAAGIARLVGIDEVLAETLPESKAAKIRELQGQGLRVAFVGDGINDAPALAQADLGIALAEGTDVAIETGDIVLMRNRITDVAVAMRVSAYILRKIRQNLFWAFCYNIVGIPIAGGILFPFFGFLLNPMIAALAMSLSSISVVTNSLLMKYKRF